MKSTIDKNGERLLSLYIDNELTPSEQRRVEEELARNPAWQDELLRLRRIQGIVAAKEPLAPAPYFTTRLAARINDEGSASAASFLPFAKKWIPAALAGGLIASLVIIVAIVFQKDAIIRYVDQQSSQVRDWYEQSMLSGKVSTLFSTLTNDDVFNFALTGRLPVDKEKGRVLQFGDQPSQGHFIEAESGAPHRTGGLTAAGLVKRLNLDKSQSIALDSILERYRDRLENSMMVSQEADSQFMAINADVWAMNKVLMVDIARTLKPPQRVQFAGMLASANLPVQLNISALDQPMTDTVVINFLKHAPSRQYVIITPETLFVKDMSKEFSDQFAIKCRQLNESQRRQMVYLAKNSQERAAEIFENLKRHQAFNDSGYKKKIDESLRRYEAQRKQFENDANNPRSIERYADRIARQAEIALSSLPDSMTLRIEIHKELMTMPPRFRDEMNHIVVSNQFVIRPRMTARDDRNRQPAPPGQVWRVQMPDSIRMVMEPKRSGVVLAGDQVIQADSFSNDAIQRIGSPGMHRSSRELELRMRQLEKELEQMRKRLEKLEEP